jgi:fumarylacetoacetate (FAA) hydrolase
MRIAQIMQRKGQSNQFFHEPFTAICISETEYLDFRKLSADPLLSSGVFESVSSLARVDYLNNAVAEILERDKGAIQRLKNSEFRFLVPIPLPRTFRDFYAFEAHVKNARKRRGLEMLPQWYEQPVFYFSNPSTLKGHEAPVFAPLGCSELDYELELGIVISDRGINIAPDDAWKHVAGFTIINDFSARDIQRKEMAVGLGPAKAKDFATGVGPYLVTLDEFQDRIDKDGRVDLEMTARVNGKELSRGNAKSMYFTWPQIIARASADAELFPGDLIGSGTVGTGCILELGPENTNGWLKPGDVVELEIERLGVLRNHIVNRPS